MATARPRVAPPTSAREAVYRAIASGGTAGREVSQIAGATGLTIIQVRKHVEFLHKTDQISRVARGCYVAKRRPTPRHRRRAVPLAYLPEARRRSMISELRKQFTRLDDQHQRFDAVAKLSPVAVRDALAAHDRGVVNAHVELLATLERERHAEWVFLGDVVVIALDDHGAARWAAACHAAFLVRYAIAAGITERGTGGAVNMATTYASAVGHDSDLAASGLAGADSRRKNMRRARGLAIATERVVNPEEQTPENAAVILARSVGLEPVIMDGRMRYALPVARRVPEPK